MRRFGTAALIAALATTGCTTAVADFELIDRVDDAVPGDIIGLRPAGTGIEYLSRRSGQVIGRGLLTDAEPTVLAAVPVGIEGEQRGLLGHVVHDGRRFAAWTQPDTMKLVVGEIGGGGVERIVWSGTSTESTAVGGHLEVFDERLLLGLGALTGWALDHGSGALILLDPDGDADQEPEVYSDGWNNPFAFTVVDNGAVWVADNAPDGSDRPVAERDGERISDALRFRPDFVDPPPQRAHSAIVELPDGRLGVCGFLDDEMLAYERTDAGLERAGTIGPCQTSATVLPDGTIVVISLDGDVPALLARPAG